MPEESYVEGRRQYATRRRVFLHKARAGGGGAQRPAAEKTKRVVRRDDSSEEEAGGGGGRRSLTAAAEAAAPLWPEGAQPEPSRAQKPSSSSSSSSSSTVASRVSLLSEAQRLPVREEQQKERCRQRLENQHLLSDELDFTEPEKQAQVGSSAASRSAPQTSAAPPTGPAPPAPTAGPAPPTAVCILADSRCIGSGVELMTVLRRRHAATVHVCSLDGGYFIVSDRAAVERLGQSDLAATQNRQRLVERVTSLQRSFERVCLIVEKDRTKPGQEMGLD
ncbi:Fanconi anemia group M protein [Liparis tanakae]|uniref:Fanconi anemia group M protein n=1 Tax=Liparis tanakae TaxID=230148 RepID=A0A4Z2FLM8_9TELE|nr:Fanconi anemia group M protein [Liparis tanakae]